MSNRKTRVLPILLTVILLVVLFNIDKITDYTAKIISPTPSVVIDPANSYASNNDYIYVQKRSTFVPYSKQDLYNIFYSVLDNGYETFTFYCPSEYTNCISDVQDITGDQTVITDFGNFVHPYNNFSNLRVVTDSLGEVDIVVTKMYSESEILDINDKLDSIYSELFTSDMDIYDKILAMHDYIIDNTTYDLDDGENSGDAYGVFFDGKAKCAGYADAMAIVLSSLGVKNYKVASSEHVWNAVYLDGEWLQLDLTWDDPVVANSVNVTDTIRHKFYMIDTETLLSYDTEEHNFDQSIYAELRVN